MTIEANNDSPSDGAIYSAVSLRDMTPEEKQLLWRALLEAAEILYSLDESEPNAVPLPAPPEGGK